MEPLLNIIYNKLDNLHSSNDIINGFRAVKWCLDSNLIQQAYSLLREAIITYVLFTTFPENFNNLVKDDEKRELVSSAFKIIGLNIDKTKWKEPAKSNDDFIIKIIDSCYPRELIKEYDSIGNYRNDIMHAGFRSDSKDAKKINDRITDVFYKTVNILDISL